MFAESMRTVAAGVTMLLMCSRVAHAQSGIDLYRRAVADYRAGTDAATAVKPLIGWNADQLEAGVKATIARADTPELEAAAAMHLEIGIAIAGLAFRSAVSYFDQASRLMAATMPPAAIRRGLSAERLTDINEANSAVLRVAASALIAVNDLGHARPLALKARKVAPLSAAALTIAGLVEEMEASRYDPELWDAVMFRTRDSRERARLLRIAEQFYRDALEADRSYVLARIRLGRVEFLEGSVSRARASLEAGRAAARDPRHRFLAALFLGGLQLQQNDVDAARLAFEEAIAIIPQSQDAISGLAYTELIAGRLNRAEQIARRYTSATTEETWWAYKNAALDFEGLKWIRERVRR